MKVVRLGLGLAGIVLAIIGVTRDDRRIVWVAIVALIVALALRLMDRRDRSTR